jgi:hypothetical protein
LPYCVGPDFRHTESKTTHSSPLPHHIENSAWKESFLEKLFAI